ncbi:helix-turn-helix domain-containing protein [Dyadobacter aurulentus]|uniref:helix-turn-helix domain-containing protein n=1 Tax=Dyadobacter sp. UC 10 TaxID=2605428 RepID=UPI001788C054|nr:AraC family transcriptional regulator [Dyadobacter sp. UC 10]
MNCQLIPAPEILRQYIRYYSIIDFRDCQAAEKSVKCFADRYPRLVVREPGQSTVTRREDNIQLPGSYLSGIDTKATEYQVRGEYAHIGASFYPQALKVFFNIDCCELVDQTVDLSLFIPAGTLEKICEVQTPQEKIAQLNQFFVNRLNQTKFEDKVINDIIHRDAESGNFRVGKYLNRYEISERSLERKFSESIGVSPKTYLRIIRFEQALELVLCKYYPHLSEVAHYLQYTDQSHFIKEFKQFSGYQPVLFQRQERLGNESAAFLMRETD